MDSFKRAAPLLFDGAFGTYYATIGGQERQCERACLSERSTVLRIHREYISAGAQAIKTNTFAANTQALGCAWDTVEQIITAAWEIAQQAVEDAPVRIFADMGPMERTPHGTTEALRIVDTFLKLGARDFLFETLHECDFAKELAAYIKDKRGDAFVLVSCAVDQDGYTRKGEFYRNIAQALQADANIDAYGFNCLTGPAHLAALIDKLNRTDKPVSVMPNAGYPAGSSGRAVYLDNVNYFADRLVQMQAHGVGILGGCCGTTPQHIRAVAKRLTQPVQVHLSERGTPVQSQATETATPNSFAEKLKAGQKVIAVELDPPLDGDFSHLAESGRAIRRAGADVITLADSPLARARADSIMMAAKVARECEIQTLPHLCCRDRNLIAIKGGLLGAAIEDIRNILVVTGDPAPHPAVKGVFSLNSYNLIRYIKTLNEEVLQGREIYIGGALNVNAPKFDTELKRAEKKISFGADYLMTQPVFTEAALANLQKAHEVLGCKLIAGILPLASYRNAVFLNNEVTGVEIPASIMEALQDKSPEETMEVSVSIAADTAKSVAAYSDGYYLMTPLRKTQLVCKLVERIQKL